MPVITNVDHARKRVTSAVVGPLSVQDVAEHLALERHFHGTAYSELIDARSALLSFSAAQVNEIVELVKRANASSPFGPTAVVVPADSDFNLARVIETLLADTCVVKPFRSEEEAHSWLGWAETPS